MERISESKILFFSVLFLIAAVPLSISNQFVSANNLVKSSAIFVLGGLIIVYFLLLLIYHSISGKNKPFIYFHSGKIDLSVLLLLTAAVVSTVFSLRPNVSFWGSYERQIGLITYLYLTALYFTAGIVLGHPGRRETALQMIEVIVLIISLYAILQYFNYDIFGLEPEWFNRPGSFLGHPVFLGGFLALSFPFSALNVSGKKNTAAKILSPLIIFTAIIVSGTRSAYAALIFQAIIMAVIYRKQLRGLAYRKTGKVVFISIILIIIIFLFIFVFKNGLISRRIPGDIDFYNARIYLWKDAVGIFLKYPVTGPGIAMFPAALEEFYSNALRFRDANVTYDHAHNNYLHTLFTMGLAGLIAYLILIYNSFVCAIKLMKNSDTKLVSSAVILMLAGYCVYGLTNFDDISILFLFFIFLSILRSLTLKKSEIRFKGFSIVTAVFSAAIIFLLLFNIPYTVNKLRADRFYKETFANYQKGNFKAAVNINNEAINLNPDCPAYRYLEASEVLNYCIDNQSLNENAKADLLKQVEAEIEKIKKDLYYVNYCNGILSLVYFEEGRNQEAENLMKEVLNKDSININYRINLARYLLKVNRLEDVKRNLDIIILMRPYDPITALLNAMYYSKMNDREKAVYYSNEVLKSEPQNRIALDILNQMK